MPEFAVREPSAHARVIDITGDITAASEDQLMDAYTRASGDGVRSIAFRSGVESREIDAMLDSVLQVSGQNLGQDDLVTLLWEANLDHIDIDYVPAEGSMGSGTAVEGEMVPWPVQGSAAVADDSGVTGVESPAVVDEAAAGAAGAVSRSDDWSTGDLTVEIEAGFEEARTTRTPQLEVWAVAFMPAADVGGVVDVLARSGLNFSLDEETRKAS